MIEHSNSFLEKYKEPVGDHLHFTVELECLRYIEFEFSNIKVPSITFRVRDNFKSPNIGTAIVEKIHELKLVQAALTFLESDFEFSYSFGSAETVRRNVDRAFEEALKFIETKVGNVEFMEPQEFIVESEYPHLQFMRIRINPVIVPSISTAADGFAVLNSPCNQKNMCKMM